MPTYEYVCPKCGYEFEEFQQMSAEPIKRCPKCKKLGVKRLVGKGAGLIFKGTGFYITDYKKTAAPPESGSSGGSEKSGSGEGKSSAGEGKGGGSEGKSGGDGKAGGSEKSGGESKSPDSSKSSSSAKSSDAKPAAKEKPKSGNKS